MLKQLIPQELNSKLDEIVTKCFEGNRISDRGMSVLGVKFAMNNTENLLHEHLAHYFPVLADKVSSYQGSRNCLTVYGLTPEDSSDYETPLAFFEKLLEYMMDLESSIGDAIELAKDDDHATFSFLVGFLNDIVKVTNQCLLLVDKAEAYGEDIMAFDRGIELFVIL